MTSYLAMVSLSLYVLGPDPVLSRRRISTSMCLILIRTSRKNILPTTTSLRWYLALAYSNSCAGSPRCQLHLDPRTVELRGIPLSDEETKLLRHRVAVRALHRDLTAYAVAR